MVVRRIVIDHVDLLVRDLERSRGFYGAALAPLGFALLDASATSASFGLEGADDFGINLAEQEPTTRAHVAFVAPNRAAVDAFWAAALAHGGREKEAPALHPEYHTGYYAAFVWDPDGNNIEAVCHERGGGSRCPAAKDAPRVAGSARHSEPAEE